MLVEYRLDPGIACFVLHLHQIKDLEAHPGISGKGQPVVGFGSASGLRPEGIGKADIYAMVGRKPVGVAIDPVVALKAKRKSLPNGKVQVHFEIFIFRQVILEEHGQVEQSVGGSGHICDFNGAFLSDFPLQMLDIQ